MKQFQPPIEELCPAIPVSETKRRKNYSEIGQFIKSVSANLVALMIFTVAMQLYLEWRINRISNNLQEQSIKINEEYQDILKQIPY